MFWLVLALACVVLVTAVVLEYRGANRELAIAQNLARRWAAGVEYDTYGVGAAWESVCPFIRPILPKRTVAVIITGQALKEFDIRVSSQQKKSLISDIGSFSYLRELQINWLSVSDEDLMPISRLNNLERLDLSHTNVSDLRFIQPETFRNLRRLVLRSTNINGNAVERIRRLENLRRLNISGTTLTYDQIESLRRDRALQIVVEPFASEPGQELLW